MDKVELLAPAGNYEALRGAIAAGADAVYLGGASYGARAYAENFTNEEICEGIHMAHVFGVKIYLTVNTLVKERELNDLFDFLLPFYQAGLDGVIVQDLGALRLIRENFKGLKICASTQMTITGAGGACLMKEEGCDQVVTARELSLEEIKKIRNEADIRIETFIHGAMCYCYSGQCLLSSILGGRSGNRGRCAQPCRLPYETEDGKSCYPLSMKDMCTLEIIPKLIEAGISTFKIEGRMKKPEYAAGVTSIYRKYIDRYYENPSAYHISEEDKLLLHSLYIRSETGEGYYNTHNGSNMLTLNSPAYSATDEELLKRIREKYIVSELRKKVSARVVLSAGKPASLTLSLKAADDHIISAKAEGECVQEAVNQPLTEEKVKEQIQKSGNSFLDITQVDVQMEEKVFMPVRLINELRRNACDALENELITFHKLNNMQREAATRRATERTVPVNRDKTEKSKSNQKTERNTNLQSLQVSVRTKEQLSAALKTVCERIYLESSMISAEVVRTIENYRLNSENKTEFLIAFPYIIRDKDRKQLTKDTELLQNHQFEGVLIRNLEGLQFVKANCMDTKVVLDTNLYLWNRESHAFFHNKADEFFLPVECNVHEWKELLKETEDYTPTAAVLVYGRLPMMVTANCIRKTMNQCREEAGVTLLKDRYQKIFPVFTECKYCYNIVYNSVPLSLHRIFMKKDLPIQNFRLDFTTESENQASSVIAYFRGIISNYNEPDYREYTTGHYKRGVD